MSQSVNLSLGPRWTGSHATPSQPKTSSTSAMGLMLGMIMPPSPLISIFLSFPLFLPPSLPASPGLCLSVSPSVYLSPPLIRRLAWNRAAALCGRWLCVICRLRLDLFHVIPQIETNTRGLASSRASALVTLLFCCCFNVSYIFRREGTSDHMPPVIALFQ